MPSAALLLTFTGAVLGDDDSEVSAQRALLREQLGDAALVDAAATVASYNAVVKVADATGIPLDEETAAATNDLRTDLGIET